MVHSTSASIHSNQVRNLSSAIQGDHQQTVEDNGIADSMRSTSPNKRPRLSYIQADVHSHPAGTAQAMASLGQIDDVQANDQNYLTGVMPQQKPEPSDDTSETSEVESPESSDPMDTDSVEGQNEASDYDSIDLDDDAESKESSNEEKNNQFILIESEESGNISDPEEPSDSESDSDFEAEQEAAQEIGGLIVALINAQRGNQDFNPVNDRRSFLNNIGFIENTLDPESVAKADELWQQCVDYHQSKLDQILSIDLDDLSETLASMYFDEKCPQNLKNQIISACKDVRATVLSLRQEEEARKNNPVEEGADLSLPISSSDLARNMRTIMQAQELLGKAGYTGIIDTGQEEMKSGLKVKRGSKTPDITFDNVAGISEAKGELEEIVAYLRNPDKFTRIGAKIPRGVLLSGEPGTGKTLLAKAVAGEAGVPFFSVSGSSFVEEYVGTGAKRVRDLFEQAKQHKSCIVFIDEIDAVGRGRNSKSSSGSQEHEHTLNALLVEMDGFDPRSGIIIMGATNRPDILDSALKRPGRFDRNVQVPLPSPTGREEILRLHARNMPIAPDVDFNSLARRAIGYSGADLANLTNEAALRAAKDNSDYVASIHFESAKDKIELGHENRSLMVSRKNLENTAYHEAGHAIVGYMMPEHEELHKVTIVPRGFALGLTHFTPDETGSISYLKLKGELATLMGGRVAEELLNGKNGITTGASNDLERASSLARKMVTEWGFSDKVGRVVSKRDRNGFPAPMSQATAQLIDDEVKALIDEAEEKARAILTHYRGQLNSMADSLLENETIGQTQIGELLQDVPKAQGFEAPAAGTSASNDDQEPKAFVFKPQPR